MNLAQVSQFLPNFYNWSMKRVQDVLESADEYKDYEAYAPFYLGKDLDQKI